MWVRAVVAALAVWCVSEAALAAGYTEVWNPPEASGHAAKSAAKKAAAGKGKGVVKADSKAGSKHVAGAARHTGPRVATAAGAGTAHGGKLAAHGGVKKVAAKGAAKDMAKGMPKSGARMPAVGKPKMKAVVTAQAGKPHAPLAQAKSGQGKIVHANLVQSRNARPHALKVSAKPATSQMNASAASANVGAAPLEAATNPATASSGSLPPILH